MITAVVMGVQTLVGVLVANIDLIVGWCVLDPSVRGLVVALVCLAPTYTYDGEVIRWYVLVDPNTQVQYLVNDRGGRCARLGIFGGVMGVRYE